MGSLGGLSDGVLGTLGPNGGGAFFAFPLAIKGGGMLDRICFAFSGDGPASDFTLAGKDPTGGAFIGIFPFLSGS